MPSSALSGPPPPVALSVPDHDFCQFLTTIFPSRPCDSSSGPAENSSWLVLAAFPLPNLRPQSPSMTIGRPFGRRSWPRCLPVAGLYTLMWPFPKLPTSRSPLNRPKPAGARARPHGAGTTVAGHLGHRGRIAARGADRRVPAVDRAVFSVEEEQRRTGVTLVVA